MPRRPRFAAPRPRARYAPVASALGLAALAACAETPSLVEAEMSGAVEGEAVMPAEAVWCAAPEGARGELQLLAVRGDSGVGIALLTDSLVAGGYPIVTAPAGGWAAAGAGAGAGAGADTTVLDAEPVVAVDGVAADTGAADTAAADTTPPDATPPDTTAGDTTARRTPARVATVGLRWYAGNSITGYQGDSGTVRLERVGERVAGRLEARLRAVSTDSLVRLAARFDAALRHGGPGCPGAAATAADSAASTGPPGTAGAATGVD